MKTFTQSLDSVATGCGRAVSWLTLLMVLLTCLVVIGRYVLSAGSIALQEAVNYMHACVFMLGIAHTLKQGGHVRVDIVYRRLTTKAQCLVNALGTVFFLLPLAAVIFFLSLDYVANSWAIRETSSESAGLPFVYLLKTLLLIMPLLLLLQGLAELLKSLAGVFRDAPVGRDSAHASTQRSDH
ncbi:MAG TPA: hypothetical protein DCZ03_00280 [Gammaproteobacteria bacterium]|nr:hypothetical protein [Gammaproteobacteria bacterium]